MAIAFLSYARADEAMCKRIEASLAVLRRQGVIETWTDRRIDPGQEFAGVIKAELERATIFLALSSIDFLNSDYCYEREMQRALERHQEGAATVVPVILRPCQWKDTPLGRLQALPVDGKPVSLYADPDQAMLEISDGIKRLATSQKEKHQTRTAEAQEYGASTAAAAPRSRSTRIPRVFTEADEDRFVEDGFEFIAGYFERSIAALESENSGFEGRFKRVDAQTLTAVIYRGGKSVQRCRISSAVTLTGRGISFSYDNTPNSYNEVLRIVSTTNGPAFVPLMRRELSVHSATGLDFEQAAEHLWQMFIHLLDR